MAKFFDFLPIVQATDLQDGFADKDDSLAILLVDDADSGIDAAIKMANYALFFVCLSNRVSH